MRASESFVVRFAMRSLVVLEMLESTTCMDVQWVCKDSTSLACPGTSDQLFLLPIAALVAETLIVHCNNLAACSLIFIPSATPSPS